MRYIQELKEGAAVKDVYLCKQKNAATTKNGKEYYRFPHDVARPNAVYKRLPNGRYKVAFIRSKDSSTKTTNTTQTKK